MRNLVLQSIFNALLISSLTKMWQVHLNPAPPIQGRKRKRADYKELPPTKRQCHGNIDPGLWDVGVMKDANASDLGSAMTVEASDSGA